MGTIRAKLGEGPRWDAVERRLLWVDIEGGLLYAGERQVSCGEKVGCAAPWDPDTVLAGLEGSVAAVALDTGAVHRLVDLPHRSSGMRSNDGACDPEGRFWVGTMAEDLTPGAGALYRYDPDGRLHTVLTELTLPNGLGWDRDASRMYHIDSTTQRIDVLDFDRASGAVANRRPFTAIAEGDGTPDGLALDDEGGVWVALFGGGEVRRFGPDGSLSGRVAVPADNVTACCFVGSRLFITTASVDVPPERAHLQPLAGSLFALEVPFSGPAAHAFAGRSQPQHGALGGGADAPAVAPEDA